MPLRFQQPAPACLLWRLPPTKPSGCFCSLLSGPEVRGPWGDPYPMTNRCGVGKAGSLALGWDTLGHNFCSRVLLRVQEGGTPHGPLPATAPWLGCFLFQSCFPHCLTCSSQEHFLQNHLPVNPHLRHCFWETMLSHWILTNTLWELNSSKIYFPDSHS